MTTTLRHQKWQLHLRRLPWQSCPIIDLLDTILSPAHLKELSVSPTSTKTLRPAYRLSNSTAARYRGKSARVVLDQGTHPVDISTALFKKNGLGPIEFERSGLRIANRRYQPRCCWFFAYQFILRIKCGRVQEKVAYDKIYLSFSGHGHKLRMNMTTDTTSLSSYFEWVKKVL